MSTSPPSECNLIGEEERKKERDVGRLNNGSKQLRKGKEGEWGFCEIANRIERRQSKQRARKVKQWSKLCLWSGCQMTNGASEVAVQLNKVLSQFIVAATDAHFTLNQATTVGLAVYSCLSAALQFLLSSSDSINSNCNIRAKEDVGHLHALITAKVLLLLVLLALYRVPVRRRL